MTGVRSAMVALALTGAASSVAAQAEFRSGVSRQAADRRAEGRQTDSAQRHNDSQRQTEAPKPVTLRQPEPQRQPEPVRKAEPRRQPEPQRQSGTSGHWQDPAPAWQSPGPAWRDLNGRSGSTHRPGQDAFRAAPDTYTSRDRSHRRDGRHDDGPRRGGKRSDNIVYGYPYVGPFGYATYPPYSYEETIVGSAVTTSAPDVDDEPHGFLRLRILPRTADVHIDGAWAGTVDDFGGSGERMLPAGPHRVEIVAPGFATLAFDVRVPANDTVTFTRELDPLDREPPRAAPPVEIPHKALYIVPRCYIGDRPPLLSDLPAGCTLDDVRVIP